MAFKRLIILFCASLSVYAGQPTVVPANGNPTDSLTIHGVWKGYQPIVRDSVAFAFHQNNFGRSYTKGQIASEFQYRLNTKKNPTTLEMRQKEGRSLAVIQFHGLDTMVLRMSPDTIFPNSISTTFDPYACTLFRVNMPPGNFPQKSFLGPVHIPSTITDTATNGR